MNTSTAALSNTDDVLVQDNGNNGNNGNTGGNTGGNGARKSPLARLRAFLLRRFHRHVGEELHELIEQREEDARPLSAEEKNLIAAALKFKDITAAGICVPRSDIVCLQVDSSFKDVVEAFSRSQHSRLPVVGRNLDDIVGFVTVKDILPHVKDPAKHFNLQGMMRKCTFVPGSMSASMVLHHMRRDKVQMAVVLDEYGGTSGLATLKDILEELIGDIEDEHETEETEMFFQSADGTWHVDSRTTVEDLEDHFQLQLAPPVEDRDYDTIGGLILHVAGRMPHKGETFELLSDVSVTVLETDGRRLTKLKMVVGS